MEDGAETWVSLDEAVATALAGVRERRKKRAPTPPGEESVGAGGSWEVPITGSATGPEPGKGCAPAVRCGGHDEGASRGAEASAPEAGRG